MTHRRPVRGGKSAAGAAIKAQYPDPHRPRATKIKHDLTLDGIEAVQKNNANVGGGGIGREGGLLLWSGWGRTTGIESLKQIVVHAKNESGLYSW